jgi:hypothetical protein
MNFPFALALAANSASHVTILSQQRIRWSAAIILHDASSTDNLRLTIRNADHRGKLRAMRIKKETLQTIQILHESFDVPSTCRRIFQIEGEIAVVPDKKFEAMTRRDGEPFFPRITPL